MSVFITSYLDSARKAAVQSMIGAVLEKEPVTVSFPLEDASLYALFEDNSTVLSALALTEESADSMECCAFTHPDFRRRGLFNELLDRVLEEIPEDTDLIFYTDHKSSGAMAALAALEAELLCDEYMMELPVPDSPAASERPHFSPAPDLFQSSLISGLSDKELPSVTETFPDGVTTRVYQNRYGSLCISVFSSYYYLYGFEIKEAFRGKGHGTRLLFDVLSDLCSFRPLPVRLQVSGDNRAALSLYKKTGFQITEILSCYLY